MAVLHPEVVLKKIDECERQLNDYYYQMREYFRFERSRRAITELKKDQEKILKALEAVNLKEWKSLEPLRLDIHIQEENFVAAIDISEDSIPFDIYEKILISEERLKDCYQQIREQSSNRRWRELMEILIPFKMNQIKEIKFYLDAHELALKG